MTKNTTRKSLALGAAAALVVTGFSAMPVNAAGLADTSFVSLAPTTGTEYGMVAQAGTTFSLTANEASTVSTGNLKFLVTDTSGVIEPTQGSTQRVLHTLTTGDKIVFDEGDDTLEIDTVDNTLDIALGDRVSFGAVIESTTGLVTTDGAVEMVKTTSSYTVTAVSADGFGFTFVTDAVEALAAGTTDIPTEVLTVGGVITVEREARHATNGTYVVDSGITTSATSEVLVLANDGLVSRSVTVQAWMDANTNDILDSTEYASPVRTVTWTKASEVVTTTVLSPIVGDAALSAVITTTPVMNGQQLIAGDQNIINAGFTRSLVDDEIFGKAEDTSNGTGSATAIWDDVAKTFTVAVTLDADASNEATAVAGSGVTDAWGNTLTGPANAASDGTNTTAGELTSVSIATTGVVTVTVLTAHFLTSGDKIFFDVDTTNDNGVVVADESAARTVTVTGANTFTFTVSETTAITAASDTALNGTGYTVETYAASSQGLVDKVGAETYTARAYVLGAASGSLVTTGVVSAVAATTTIATASTSAIQGLSFSAVGTNTTKVLAGTLSVPVTITVTDSLGVAVGAGRAVALALSSTTLGTYKVNGKTADTVMTDANGQVAATVTTTTGTNTATATLTATAENVAAADIDLVWATAVYGLVDLSASGGTLSAGAVPRNIVKLGSYTMSLMVADQWFNVPTDTYRLNVTGEGVSGSYVTLVGGKATVTATDTGVFGTSMDTVVVLEKLSGATVVSSATYTFTAGLTAAYKIAVGAAGTTLYGNTVVASVAVAKKALVEIDSRSSSLATPGYVNNLVLNGMVTDKATSALKSGAYVTVSGPSNILFESASVEARGSLTLLTGTDGKFEILAYSTTAQTDSVITFTTSDGATGTIKVSFTGIGVGEGTSLVVTTPAAVKPASTFQVKAKLADAYGNGVNAGATAIKVTYTGPGIVFGTLPTTTDANGELQFAVLLGSNDTGTITVTVSYDQNGDLDYVDTKDLVTTATTVINATGVVAADAKVNVGSFKGYVALYAKGYKGKKMSAIVAGKWIVVASLASDFERVVRYTGAGYDIVTTIYIDGVSVQSFNVTTK